MPIQFKKTLPNGLVILDEECAGGLTANKQILIGKRNNPRDPNDSIAHLKPLPGTKPQKYELWLSMKIPIEFSPFIGTIEKQQEYIGKWKIKKRSAKDSRIVKKKTKPVR